MALDSHSQMEKTELMERMDEWKDVLGDKAAISPQVPSVLSKVGAMGTNPFEPHAILHKLINNNNNNGTVPKDTKISRKAYWLSKPKPNVLTN